MTCSARELLALLADGELHSGEQLARQVGVTRAAIWKQVGELRTLGVEIESLDRRGYRLTRPVELLEAERICEAARAGGLRIPDDIEVLFEIGSTNDYLYAEQAQDRSHRRVAFAEIQHAGRGRRGRDWKSPFGSSLTFSLAWRFKEMPPDLSALGLAMGVGVAQALRQAGARRVMLKWPNDIVADGRKLGGLLVQLRSEVSGPAFAVIGLGVNLSLPPGFGASINDPGALPVTDVASLVGEQGPGRNELAARLAAAMLDAVERFEQGGFQRFADAWQRFDSLRGLAVRVTQGDDGFEGVASGADSDGALCLEIDGRVRRFFSGDVSVRPARVP
jgi:BirA family biotin operon repressor/biotin-[acetyl-CoA-carboxylase] ligase